MKERESFNSKRGRAWLLWLVVPRLRLWIKGKFSDLDWLLKAWVILSAFGALGSVATVALDVSRAVKWESQGRSTEPQLDPVAPGSQQARRDGIENRQQIQPKMREHREVTQPHLPYPNVSGPDDAVQKYPAHPSPHDQERLEDPVPEKFRDEQSSASPRSADEITPRSLHLHISGREHPFSRHNSIY